MTKDEWSDLMALSDSEIRKDILYVMKELNLGRMPSRKEIVSIKHNSILANSIAKSGGYKHWADKLLLDLKDSETKTGWDAEEIAKVSMETSLGYKVEKMSTKHPYDLLVNNFIKVDVKCSKPFKHEGKRAHAFWINKTHSTCDIYLIYALDEEGKIERTFIIPGYELRVKTLFIGRKTKYDKFLERWDYFEKYNEFHEQLCRI